MLEKRNRIRSRKFPFFSLVNLNSPVVFAFFIGFGAGLITYSTLNEGWVASSTEKAHIRVCFSPQGNCTEKIVDIVDSAQSSILVHAFSFTCPQIANALARAFEKGVDVKILVHKSQIHDRHSQVSFLAQKGIPIFIDPASGIAHNKIMILDHRYTLTGSFNFTKNANCRNAENVLFIDDPSLAAIYRKNWERRAASGQKLITPMLSELN